MGLEGWGDLILGGIWLVYGVDYLLFPESDRLKKFRERYSKRMTEKNRRTYAIVSGLTLLAMGAVYGGVGVWLLFFVPELRYVLPQWVHTMKTAILLLGVVAGFIAERLLLRKKSDN